MTINGLSSNSMVSITIGPEFTGGFVYVTVISGENICGSFINVLLCEDCPPPPPPPPSCTLLPEFTIPIHMGHDCWYIAVSNHAFPGLENCSDFEWSTPNPDRIGIYPTYVDCKYPTIPLPTVCGQGMHFKFLNGATNGNIRVRCKDCEEYSYLFVNEDDLIKD